MTWIQGPQNTHTSNLHRTELMSKHTRIKYTTDDDYYPSVCLQFQSSL